MTVKQQRRAKAEKAAEIASRIKTSPSAHQLLLERKEPPRLLEDRSENAATQALIEQHHDIVAIVDRLGAVIRTSIGLLPEAQKRRLFNELMGTLIQKLERHFQYEERGGFMTDVVQRRPALAADVERLLTEHGNMIGQLRWIRARCIELDLETLQKHVQSFVDKFSHHEHHETDLIQGVYYGETGAGD